MKINPYQILKIDPNSDPIMAYNMSANTQPIYDKNTGVSIVDFFTKNYPTLSLLYLAIGPSILCIIGLFAANIKVLNIKSEIFDIQEDALNLFPLRRHHHYNAEGYKIIGNFIYSKIRDN